MQDQISLSLNVYVSEGTLTLADDAEAGAFGPVAREAKIKNLRAYPFSQTLVKLFLQRI